MAQIAKAQKKFFGEDCACWKPPNPRAQICAEESSCGAATVKYSFDHKAGALPCLTFLSKHFCERPQRVGPAHTVTAVSNNLLSYSPRSRLSDRGHNSRLEIKLILKKYMQVFDNDVIIGIILIYSLC